MLRRALPPSRDIVEDRARRVRRRGGDDRRRGAGVRRPGAEGRLSTGRLIVCPTPIGNLEDVTLRVLAALREADIVACEDTRRTRVLLDRYGVAGKLVSYHEHNERARAGELVARMRDGAVVALVSDAGTPLVSDPGFVLGAGVRGGGAGGRGAAGAVGGAGGARGERAAGRPVAVRRLPAAQEGRAAGGVRRRRKRSSRSSRRAGWPRRCRCSPSSTRSARSRSARELTKIHEEVVRGTAAELAARYADEPPRGEVALVVGGAPSVVDEIGPALDAVRRLVEAGAKPRPAASVVSRPDRRSRQPAVPRVDGALGAVRRRRARSPTRLRAAAHGTVEISAIRCAPSRW